MPDAPAGAIDLCYDTTGDPSDPAVVLIAGLGQQMIAWRAEAVDDLASRGFFVIRFDNRDSGLSTKVGGKVDIAAAFSAALSGRTPDVPYTLSDMAGDSFTVLDHLGIERAHFVGVSMGGMVAQRAAIDRPERVASLTSIMSTTGSSSVGQARPDAAALLMKTPSPGRDAAIAGSMDAMRLYWGPHHWDVDRARSRATAAHDRSFYPEGTGRQFAAILADGDRTNSLRALGVPTLVIHGDADPLIDISGGVAVADAVAEAELVVVQTMGHDVPPSLWPQVRDAMVAHFEAHSPC